MEMPEGEYFNERNRLVMQLIEPLKNQNVWLPPLEWDQIHLPIVYRHEHLGYTREGYAVRLRTWVESHVTIPVHSLTTFAIFEEFFLRSEPLEDLFSYQDRNQVPNVEWQ